MTRKTLRQMLSAMIVVALLSAAMILPVFAAEVYPVTGITVSGDVSLSNGTVTDSQGNAWVAYNYTDTVKVTYTGTNAAVVSFNYWISTSSRGGTIKMAGTQITNTESALYSQKMENGDTVTFELTSAKWGVVTLNLSGFSVVEIQDDVNATIEYDSNKGSVNLGGSAVSSGDSATATGGTLAAVATPVSGCKFLGWVNTDTDELLSTASSDTLNVPQNMNIQAVFVNSTSDAAWFLAGGNHLYDGLNEASTYASTASTKTVVLMNDGTLPAGDYTIPSGVTLLIPYDSGNTLCTTSPSVNDSAVVAPTAYRTLTMANGANIVVNGGISVAGSQTAKYPQNGNVTGPVGVINMNAGSNITVNSGGALYAWGYVAGSGTVTIERDGTVYEDFQVRDYRGGDVTTTLTSTSGNNVKTWHIFPMSQYYVQNVQVPMTLKAGAVEYGFFSVTANLIGIKSEPVNFIGADSMFQITNGYIIKDYDESTDRLIIDVHGNLEVNPFSIEIQVQFLSGAITINSANYDLPLNSNITINLNGTSTVELNQDLLMLPGSVINIGEDATLKVNNSKRLIVYDQNQWLNGRSGDTTTSLYCSDLNKALVPLAYVFNGTTGAEPAYTRTTADLVDAQIIVDGTLDASGGYLYTTAGSGNICSSGNGKVILQQTSDSTAYQIEQKRNGDGDFDSSTELDAHTITSAQLRNEDSTYALTANSGTSPNTYTYVDGFWRCATHTWENYTCSVCGCPLFTIDAANVILGNNLDMLFAFTYYGTDTLTTDSGYYIQLVRSFADTEKTDEVAYQIGDWTPLKDSDGNVIANRYYITYSNLAAKEMCDEIQLYVCDKDGTQVSVTSEDSMRAYAMRQIEKFEQIKDSDEILTLLVDMLNYGAEAQKRFTYNTDDLANSLLTDEQQEAYATTTVTKGLAEGAESAVQSPWVASNLVTTSNIQFLLAFDGITDGMTATVTFTNHYGGDPTSINITEFGTAGNYRYVAIEELVVADAWQPVTVTIYNSDGSTYATCVDSIAGYLARYTAYSKINAAYLKFAQAADAYFH